MRILKGLAAKSNLPSQEKRCPSLWGAGAERATNDERGNDGLEAPFFKQATLCSAEARAADLHVLEAAEHEGRRQVLGRAPPGSSRGPPAYSWATPLRARRIDA